VSPWKKQLSKQSPNGATLAPILAMSNKPPVKIATFDTTGDFRGNLIYQLRVLTDLGFELDYSDPTKHPDVIISPPPVGDRTVYTEAWDVCDSLHECPVNKDHATGRRETDFLIDAFSGTVVPDFIHDHYGIELLTNPKLTERIANSALTGFSAKRVPIRVNQSQIEDLQIDRATFHGARCHRESVIVIPPDELNRCPHCGAGPVICPACHNAMRECTDCKAKLFGRKARPAKPGIEPCFVSDPVPVKRRITDGHRWDGADFIDFPDIGFVTRRVVDFLLSIHANNFIASPCDVDVSKMSSTLLRQLEHPAPPR
jgi:hypothetical protein